MATTFTFEEVSQAPSQTFTFEDLQATPTPVAAPKSRDFQFSDIFAVPAAVGEVGLQMGTGLGSQIVGGYRGIKSLLSGEGVDEAARKVTEVTEGGTYQPKTELGQGASQVVAYPFQKGMELTKQAGGAIGEFVGGEQGRIAGESLGEQLIPVAGALAPLVPVARGTLSKPSAAKMSAKIEEMQKAAPKIEIAKKGQELGFVFDPAEINPTAKNKIQTFVAGDRQVDLLAARKNAEAGQNVIKQELQIDPDVALNKGTVNAAIEKFGTAYEDVRGLGKLNGSQDIASKLRSSFPEEIPGAEASINKARKVLDKVANRVESGTLTGDTVVDFIKYYRNEAKKIKNSSASKESQRAKADAYMDAANALEDLIEANIKDKTVLSNFRQSRENIAKAYTVNEIINPVTGMPDLTLLTTGKLADAPLTGGLKTLRDIAFTFPDTVALGSKYGDMAATLPRTGPGGSAGALAGSAVGATAQGSVIGAAYGKLLGNRVREKLLSPEYQRANLLPEYARYINEGRIQSPLTQSMPRAVPPAPTSGMLGIGVKPRIKLKSQGLLYGEE